MRKEKELVYLLSSAAFVSFVWIGSNLYHTYITSTITEPLTTFIRPIPEHFNARSIEAILQRDETPLTYELQGKGKPEAEASSEADLIPPAEVTVTPIPEPSKEPTP